MNPRDHQLFKKYPLVGSETISLGQVPTPYQIYDGYALFIGGVCELAAVRGLIKDEGVVPIQTTDGKAVMGAWVCNFTDASLGPHHELQFSILVSRQEAAPEAPHPSLTLALMSRPDVQMLCHGLWNNTPIAVAYNRELLSLNAQLTDSHIERRSDSIGFEFRDGRARPLFSGTINSPQRASVRASFSLFSKLGFRRGLALARQPWATSQVTNPLGVVLNRNAVAEALLKPEAFALRYFDPRKDTLVIGDTPYRSLLFTPHIVYYMNGFRFVYLQPR